MVDKIIEIPKVVEPRDVALRMKLDYSRGVKDQVTRDLEAACGLLWKLDKQDLDIDSFLAEAAETISKTFGIESVAIGLLDISDRKYRYEVVYGLEKDVAEGFKSLEYTREELLDAKNYPSHDISPRTKLFLSEEHPYAEGEEFTYRRPGLIGMKRRTASDSLEADYLDFFFYSTDGGILGFIEVSGTRLRKLPDTTTIRWIELITAIVGVAVRRRI
jgi:hypothetical protein